MYGDGIVRAESRALYPHQQKAYRFLRKRKRAALFMEMRLGKTLVIIRRLKRLKLRWILIVAPNSAIGSWFDELRLEGETHVADLRGTRSERVNMLGRGCTWNVINKEGFLSLPEIGDVKWDAVILDESTFIKNPRAKVTQFFLKHFKQVPYRYILTGTPNPEGDLDLYCQMQFLNNSFCRCRNYWQFRHEFFAPDTRGFKWTAKLGVSEVIQHNLSLHSFILRRKDVTLGTHKVKEVRHVEFNAELKRVYQILEEEFILDLEGRPEQKLFWKTSQYVFARKLCSGLDTEGRLVWNGKVKELEYLLMNELANDQVVVWFVFNDSIRACQEVLAKQTSIAALHGEVAIETREQIRQSFIRGEVRVLLLQVKVAEMGMNLSVADTAIYYEEPVSLLSRQQSEDRILSLSKTSPLLYLYLQVPNTVEEDIHFMMGIKSWQSSITLSRALREQMERRYGQ